MSKIILEFDALEDCVEAQCAINGTKWMSLAFDIDRQLRNTTKYGKSVLGNEDASDIELDIAEKYREILRDLMAQSGLTFE